MVHHGSSPFRKGNMFHSNIWKFVVASLDKSNDMIRPLFLRNFMSSNVSKHTACANLKIHHIHEYHVINQYLNIYSHRIHVWNIYPHLL